MGIIIVFASYASKSCHQEVIVTNSVPIRVASLGCSEEARDFLVNTVQLWNSLAVLWDKTAQSLWLRCGSPGCTAPSSVIAPALVFQLWPGKLSLWWGRGEAGLYSDVFLPLVPDWSISMQIRTPDPQFGPNSTILISWNGAALIGGREVN